MSLINDALKKARTAQPAGAASSTADGPALRPLEAGTRGNGASIFTLPFIIAVVLVLACVLLWAWYRSGQVLVVHAKTTAATSRTVTTVMPVATIAKVATPSATEAGSANVLQVAQAPKPAAPVYQLQGIFFSEKKPAAVINGDLVHVGSRVEQGRVVAIDEESATVVTSAGDTNVLVLTR
jgi:hypothetical protein